MRPRTHKTQYFEMMGVQGLYHDGWMLSAVPVRAAVGAAGQGDPGSRQRATSSSSTTSRKDWTQYTDVAAAESRQAARRCRT